MEQQNLTLSHDPSTELEPPRPNNDRNANTFHLLMDFFTNWQGIDEWFM